jgi:hypothetical protein
VPCAGVTATIDSKEYKWSEWWCDLEGVVLYSKAEISQEYRDKLTKNIQEYVMPENDEKE